MIRSVWTDVDNTLLDFDACVEQTLRSGFPRFVHRELEDWMLPVFHRVNGSLWRRIEEGTLTFEELQRIRFACVFEELRVDGDGPALERYLRESIHESAIPVKGAAELVAALSGRCLLCAASNGPQEQQLHRLELAGMKDAFDYCFISERIGASKPSAAFFEAGLAEINRDLTAAGEPELAPHEVLVFGDSLTSDMAGGISCGMRTCFYNREHREIPPELPIDYVVDTLSEAQKLLCGEEILR